MPSDVLRLDAPSWVSYRLTHIGPRDVEAVTDNTELGQRGM